MDKQVKIRDWIPELPKRGRITFSTDDIYRQYPSLNKAAVTSVLRRLVEKGALLRKYR
ncbi:MAG: BlaI/MecI/CopY family transcriptional regulator [Prevotella sp.]|jgi:predicted transcriptional regulator|nr:BlaI/MecI/CopY family transcriptional regulator [Prevotella sp.]